MSCLEWREGLNVLIKPSGRSMNAPHLVYFAGPMCSWRRGFASVMNVIAAVLPAIAGLLTAAA